MAIFSATIYGGVMTYFVLKIDLHSILFVHSNFKLIYFLKFDVYTINSSISKLSLEFLYSSR